MSRILLPAAALLAALLPSLPVRSQESLAQASNVVLYRNSGTDAGVGVVSQDSQGSLAEAADDFTVPANATWTIREVDVRGHYFDGSGPADSQTVTFYEAAHGRVGAVIARATRVAFADRDGSFRIRIPPTTLGPGSYFVSVVANLDRTRGGEWHWENMTQVHGHRPQWQDPGGSTCGHWTSESRCFGPGTGDHFFTLRGTVP